MQSISSIQHRLNELKNQIHLARQQLPGRPFSKAIWEEAKQLAQQMGISPVSKKTGLSYGRLKLALQKENDIVSSSNPQNEVHSKKTFLEVPVGTKSASSLKEQPLELQIKIGNKILKLEWTSC